MLRRGENHASAFESSVECPQVHIGGVSYDYRVDCWQLSSNWGKRYGHWHQRRGLEEIIQTIRLRWAQPKAEYKRHWLRSCCRQEHRRPVQRQDWSLLWAWKRQLVYIQFWVDGTNRDSDILWTFLRWKVYHKLNGTSFQLGTKRSKIHCEIHSWLRRLIPYYRGLPARQKWVRVGVVLLRLLQSAKRFHRLSLARYRSSQIDLKHKWGSCWSKAIKR